MAVLNYSISQLSEACVDSSYREKLRENPEAQPGVHFGSDAGKALPESLFKRLVERFITALQSEEHHERVDLISEKELWTFFYEDFANFALQNLIKQKRVDAATALSDALQEFCENTAKRRERIPGCKTWRQIFVPDAQKIDGVVLELDGDQIKVSGEVDALRANSADGLELLGFQMTDAAEPENDKVRMALLARILELSGGRRKKVSVKGGSLEYYNPDRSQLDVPLTDLQQKYADAVVPVLKELFGSEQAPEQTEEKPEAASLGSLA